jgi:hypothetical protein
MFGLLVLVGLFVALTPGVLFRLKGSKKMSAAMHAVLFGVVAYIVSNYLISYEGFQPPPTGSPCPAGTSYLAKLKQCEGEGTCPDGYEKNGRSCELYVQPQCPEGSQLDGERCKTTVSPICPSGFTLASGSCRIPPSCPAGHTIKTSILSGATCVPPGDVKAKIAAVSVKKAPVSAVKPPAFLLDMNGKEVRVGSIVSCGQHTSINVDIIDNTFTFTGTIHTTGGKRRIRTSANKCTLVENTASTLDDVPPADGPTPVVSTQGSAKGSASESFASFFR